MTRGNIRIPNKICGLDRLWESLPGNFGPDQGFNTSRNGECRQEPGVRSEGGVCLCFIGCF